VERNCWDISYTSETYPFPLYQPCLAFLALTSIFAFWLFLESVMASFYNTAAGGQGVDGNIVAGPGNGDVYVQQSQLSAYSNNNTQWQNPSSTQQQQSQNGQSVMYGQSSLSREQQVGQLSFFSGMQQQGTQVATQIVADFATGNLTGEKISEKLMDGIGKGFGGGIPGLEYVMGSLRGYFAVDNRYVKRKMAKLLFPFLNKQWKRVVSCCCTCE
jgi:hypothetical protein